MTIKNITTQSKSKGQPAIQIRHGQLRIASGSLGASDIKTRSKDGILKTPPLDVRGVAARATGNETFFTDFEDYAEMKVFNLNGDEQTWGIHGEEGSRCAVINWNSELTMDDWIIMPGVTLEGGKAYEVSLDMWGKGDSYPEKLEVFLGNAQDPSAMTLEAIPLTTYGGTTAKKITGLVAIPSSGTYFLGVHGCSDPDMYTLFIDNLSIGAPISSDMPAKAESLSVTQREGEEGIATITFTAPSTRFNGERLSSLTKIEVLRNGVVVKTFNNPTPGAVLSFDDECGTGKFTWTVIAYNESGASLETSVTASLIGTYTVPYHKDFPTADSLDEMVIIDADGDDNTWYWDQYQHYAALSAPDAGSNDWIITPPVRLDAGKVYEFASLVSAGNPEAFPPRIAIYVGNNPSPEAMDITIVPPTQITKYDTYFNESFSVATDGKYYIGVHGCSTEWLALIKLMYLDITGGAEAEGPATVMDAVIEPDWSARTNTANISFTAPVTTGSGNQLTSISRIDLERNGIVVKTFENPAPGSQHSYTDEVPEAGDYIYAIVPFNEIGQGGKFEKTISIGVEGKSVPYIEDFSSSDRFDNELTFIDYNEDGTSFWHATQTDPPYAWIHYGDSSPSNDDYLIVPAIRLEANTQYRVEADAWGYSEKMRILGGCAPKVEDLVTEILPVTALSGKQQTYGGSFTSTYAGNYFFAIHACADNRMDDFHVTDIKITKIGAADAPSAIKDLVITPGNGNELNFSFKVPETSVAGEPISAIDKIEVCRDGASVKTFGNPTPGIILSFSDTPASEGEYTYTFTPYAADAEGEILSHVAFVGTDLPAMPKNITATYTGDGNVKITWDPVTTTAHGISVPASAYVILEVKNEVQKQLSTVSANEYTYKAVDPEEQALVYYGIFPVNADGEVGEYGLSNDCYAGKPYTMSFKESFADGGMTSIVRIQNVIFEPEWALATNASFSDVQPSDGDNGMVAMRGGMGASGRLSTGMIDLATNAVSPTLSFNIYNISPTEYDNEIHMDIREVGSDEWTEIGSHVIGNLSDKAGWVRVTADLGAYKGKNVFIGIRPVGKNYLWTIFDAIRVSNLTDNDLGANIGISASSVNAGENVSATVTICNNGQAKSGEFQVELYKNEKNVDTRKGRNIEPGETKTFFFNQTLDVQDEDIVNYYAKVVYDGDENEADNTTKVLSVEVIKPIYPTVRDLSGKSEGSLVTLSWTEPSLDNVAPEMRTETFENAESWNRTGVCGWTFADADNTPSGGFEQFSFPGITTAETVTSFFVIDKNEETLGDYGALFDGVDGSSKSLGALLRYDQGTADDWAISPELYGGRQIVHLFVKALLESYPETFQGYYSTGGTSPEDFIAVGTPVTYNGDWTEVTVSLPDGARRFAIRRISNSGALMMVDDISLRLAGDEPENLKLIGYNVYRNGERVNAAPLETTSYSETNPDDGNHTYAVSALYEQGESNTVHTSVDVSEVASVISSDVKAYGGAGSVVISDAEGLDVTVTALDGRIIFNDKGESRMTVRASKGVYVIKAGVRSFKVLVK